MEEIGSRLKTAREQKGISLAQAEEETKIRRKYIQALEEGRKTELPGEVYLKGFLRTYGNYLGLDGSHLVDEYKETTAVRRQPKEGPPVARPARDEAPVSVPEVATVQRRARPPRRRPPIGRPAIQGISSGVSGRRVMMMLLVVGALGAIGYLGWLIALQFNAANLPPANEPPVAAPAPPPVTPAPPPAETTAPPPKLPDPPKVIMSRGEGEQVHFAVPAKEAVVGLEFTADERLWMRATVDGKQTWEGFPADHAQYRQRMEFKGSSVQLRMGHMNGVNVVVNGQRFEQPLTKGPYTLVFNTQK